MGEEMIKTFDKRGHELGELPLQQAITRMRTFSLEKGDSPFSISVVYLILLTSSGLIRLVRRGRVQSNPLMFDKTVGGHVNSKETDIEAVAREFLEELGRPLMVTTPSYFKEMISRSDLTKMAVARPVGTEQWDVSIRVMSDGVTRWKKRVCSKTFIGYFDGSFCPDGDEALEERQFSLSELQSAFSTGVGVEFTCDIKMLVDRHAHLLKPINNQTPATL